MKQRLLSVIVAALLLCGQIVPQPVNAEDTAIMLMPNYTPITQTTSLCRIHVAAGTEFTVSVYQHSEEREALLMYQYSDTPTEDTLYCCIQMEPGEYTLELSVPAISGCPTMLRQNIAFTVVNPDYAADYDATILTVELAAATQTDTALGFTETVQESYIENGTEYINAAFICNTASGLRGDADLSGVIETNDAIIALQEYNASILQMPTDHTEVQRICADIDGDGIIQTKDAIGILRYYTALLIGETPDWSSYI